MLTGRRTDAQPCRPGDAFCRRLDLDLEPVDVLRALRGRPGLVGLIGDWCGGGAVVACDPVEVLPEHADPFEVVDLAALGNHGGRRPVFAGGWIGWWGYQLGRRLERVPPPPPRPSPQPDHWLGRYEWVLRGDPDGAWWFESLLSAPAAELRLRELADSLAAADHTARDFDLGAFTATPTPERHLAAVRGTVDRIGAGEIFQANLCLRLEASFSGDPLDVFCRGVTALRPPYAAFLDAGSRAVASFSPELFLRRRGDTVLTAPIKGTAPLDADPAELTASAKDRAENVMIVDLMRNDLGRVCVPGSIAVSALATAEERAGVRHLVSEVTGRMRPAATDADLLRATFPPGSVTGAPKIRAMEVIHELEATGRECYTGAIGYASPIAGLETSVVIRTLEFAGDRVWMGVGGGVVADSTPAAELAECRAKAAPVLAALGADLDLAAPDVVPRPATLVRSAPGQTSAAEARAVPAGSGGRPASTRRPDPAAGVFTTILVRDGRPVLLDAHLDRLRASAAELFGTDLPVDELVTRVQRAVGGAPGRPDSRRLRLSVDPDGAVRADSRPHPEDDREAGWHLVPATLPGGLGRHKWGDRSLLDRLGAGTTTDHTDVLLVDADGSVLETGRANLFLVLDDGVHTPRLDGRILPGIARRAVVDLLRSRRVPVQERDLDLGDLSGAAEVFVTNALRGVVPVRSCAGVRGWGIGPTTHFLRSALASAWASGGADRRTAPAPTPRQATAARVLIVDNYDSFVHNLAQYAAELGAAVTVVRNDAHSVDGLAAALTRGEFSHLLLSPGPGRPEDAGVSTDLVRRVGAHVPTLGVCLGHQCIATAYGARVVRAPRPVHGHPALVHHDGRGVFTGVDGPCVAARYHSLVVEQLPDELEATARTADGTVMGLRHRSHPVEGLQVHPESVLTPFGHTLLGNFLAGPLRPVSGSSSPGTHARSCDPGNPR